VELTGLAAFAPDDPEPEFVDVNGRNEAVVTLQENNHLAIVDLETLTVKKHFPMGTVTLRGVDATDDDVIALKDTVRDVPREPDAVAWVPGFLGRANVATANEGDLFGGSRGFSIFQRDRDVVYDSGNAYEELAVQHVGIAVGNRRNLRQPHPQRIGGLWRKLPGDRGPRARLRIEDPQRVRLGSLRALRPPASSSRFSQAGVIERDNRTGDFAVWKTLVKIDRASMADGLVSNAEKSAYDLLPALKGSNGWITDKPEGAAITENGETFVVTDNDGVDDWSGETWFFNLGRHWRLF
jgi:hypothetical protein